MKKCSINRAALKHNQPPPKNVSQAWCSQELGNALRFTHSIGKFVHWKSVSFHNNMNRCIYKFFMLHLFRLHGMFQETKCRRRIWPFSPPDHKWSSLATFEPHQEHIDPQHVAFQNPSGKCARMQFVFNNCHDLSYEVFLIGTRYELWVDPTASAQPL